jgi:hypothetical protein
MSQKVFRKDVARISASKFGEARISKEKGMEKLRPTEVKKLSEEIAEGGIIKSSFDRKLKEAGLEGEQYGKRQRIIKTVFGGEKSLKEKAQEDKRIRLRKQVLAQQSMASAGLVEAKERSGSGIGRKSDYTRLNLSGQKYKVGMGGENLSEDDLRGQGGENKFGRTSALSPYTVDDDPSKAPTASIRQESAASVAGGYGAVKPKSSLIKSNNIPGGNLGNTGSLRGKRPIGM